jgi:uncharacterized protein YbjT (DUF2867 family)
LLEATEVPQDRFPTKRMYEITGEGEEVLRRWLEESPMVPERQRNLFLVLADRPQASFRHATAMFGVSGSRRTSSGSLRSVRCCSRLPVVVRRRAASGADGRECVLVVGREERRIRILVVGATGGLGQDVLGAALAGGHDTAALVRGPAQAALPGQVEIIQGDVLDPSSLAAAVHGRDGVICALGTPSPRRRSTLLEDGTRNLVGAMRQAGVRRLVCVTLLGVGSSRANATLLYRGVILRVLAPMVPDKERQEGVVGDSDLEWVLVRPGRFVAGKPRGDLRVIREGERGRVGHVVRADLARFLVDCTTSGTYVREAVVVGS